MDWALSRIKKFQFLLFFLTPFLVFSQKPGELAEKAEDLLYKEDFEAALVAYQEVLQTSNSVKAQYHAEICSVLTKYPQKPLDKFLELGVTMSRSDKFYSYWLGRMLYGQYEFEKAIESWKKFLDIKKYKSRRIITETNSFIKQAERVMAFYKKPETHHAQRLPDVINTEFSEITPTYIDNLNELLYASSYESSNITHSEHPFHIFSSFFDGTNWSKPEIISSLGSYDESNANLEIIGNDGRLLMFKPSKSGGLHESELKHDSIWTQPHLFDLHIKQSRLKPHFYVNEQENVLIFSTKTKGKDGNLDLQYSVRAGGKWTKPRPFGPTINTNGNEESAFLASDGKTLYFSSDEHSSIGGYDIFKSVYDSIGDQWSTPENLGFPINTIGNELYFKLKPNGREGYFSSDRFHSIGGYDIYHFWEASYNLVTGKVLNEQNEPITNAYVRFHPTQYLDTDFNGISNDGGIYELHLIPGDDYDVEVFVDHELIFQKTISIKEEHDPNIVINVDLIMGTGGPLTAARDVSFHSSKPHATTLNDHLDAEEHHNKTPVPKEVSPLNDLGSKFRRGHKALMHNVYFGTGHADLSDGDKETLQELLDLMNEYDDLNVEIAGHTDNVGTTNFNLKLSEDRANSVAQYLISKGIDENRLQPVGYGEDRPMASNDDEIGGRELNRRIEIIVIE